MEDSCFGFDMLMAFSSKNHEMYNWGYSYCYRVKDIKEHVDLKRAETILGSMVFHFFCVDDNDKIIPSNRLTILSRPGQSVKILREGNETYKNTEFGCYGSLEEAVAVHAYTNSGWWMDWPEAVDGIEESFKNPPPALLAAAPTEHVVSPAPLKAVKTVPLLMPPKAAAALTTAKALEYNFIPAGKHIYANTPHGMITAVKLKSGGFFVIVSKKGQTTEYDNVQQLYNDQEITGDLVY